MAIKAKFLIESKTKTMGWDTKSGTAVPAPQYLIKGRPVHTGSPENEQYFQATPWGVLELGVLNKAAADQLEPGDEVFVTIEKA